MSMNVVVTAAVGGVGMTNKIRQGQKVAGEKRSSLLTWRDIEEEVML
jgi:hypothetical protein